MDLDPDWPHVAFVDGVDVVALPSTDGPQLWSFIDGEWRSEDLPPGRLGDGLRAQPREEDDPSDPIHADDRLFVVIDGHIWHRATG